MDYPRITIVTPSFNQAQYLEQTIDSILSQGYPNLEYIIIDGGSTDGSDEIIRKYSSHLAYWVSEPDRGQTHAINKGMAKATGEIRAYLNSDDVYLPGALESVAEYSMQQPKCDLIHGHCRIIDVDGKTIGQRTGRIHHYNEILNLWDVWWGKRNFVQPEVFWTRRIAERIGPFREDLYLVMDYEYWLRILQAGGRVGFIDRELACFRIQPNQKSTQPQRTSDELIGVVKPHILNRNTELKWQERMMLLGNYMFCNELQKEIADSLHNCETRWQRWRRLFWFSIKHPEMCMSPRFRGRLINGISIGNGHSDL